MLGLILFLGCTGFCAWRIATRLEVFEPEPLTRVERGVWCGVLGLGLWLAQGHVLALAGLFRPGPLLVTSAAILVGILWTARGQRPGFTSTAGSIRRRILGLRRGIDSILRQHFVPTVHLPLTLVAACLLYSVAALAVLPVSNHDALSYHFPKAMRLVSTGAFGLYPSQDLRVTYFPHNYEMLVATFLTFIRTDTSTGFITAGSLLLFLATSFSLFKRIWRTTDVAALTLSIVMASPVLFLHITAHKNDLLMGAVTLNALVWLGRYAARAGAGSAIVGLVALALAVGTKVNGFFVMLVALLLLWRAWRAGVWKPTIATATMQAACITVLVLSLGGAQYVANLFATGKLQGALQVATPNALNTVAFPAYWQVPRFTLMLLAQPLVARGQYFHVPGSREAWFWPPYELYFSHYGLHVSVLILLMPLTVWWAKKRIDASLRTELSGISIAALALVGLNTLIGLRPYGSFAFIPRFLFFALPILLVWTWCPAVKYVQKIRVLASLPLVASLVIPMAYIRVTVTKDGFTPLSWVETLWVSPELRRDVFHSPWRAANVVDHLAAPDATIAVDAGYDGWTYPLYGATLTRRVELILGDSAQYIPGPEVEWVVVDRATSIVWGHPDFQSMADALRYIDRGPLTDTDQWVHRSLMQNPDFSCVYFYPSRFQAVFRRVSPGDVGSEDSVDCRLNRLTQQ